jgi:hypothetical protein
VCEWFKSHGSLKVSAVGGSVHVTSREHKKHKSPLEVLGNKLFDQIPHAGHAAKLVTAANSLTSSQPWIVHFERYPKNKDKGSRSVVSGTPVEEVAKVMGLA